MVCHSHFSQDLLTDVIGWDVMNWSLALNFWQSQLTVDWPSCHVLELGCGDNGSLSLWFALQKSSVICSGYQGVPHKTKLTHQKYAAANRIAYETIDARSISYRSMFDLVVFKSMLGGIVRDGPLSIAEHVLEEIFLALKPGGALLFVENLRSTMFHQVMRKKYGAGWNKWRYFTIEEIRNLCACYHTFQYATFGFLGCFGKTENQRVVLGKIDRVLARSILPPSCNYIIAGIARK
jgi:SAM-dependent methyltransferase